MNKRETALEIIRIEYAKYGESTRTSMRAYVENKISMDAYNVAVRKGMRAYEEKNIPRVRIVPNNNDESTRK